MKLISVICLLLAAILLSGCASLRASNAVDELAVTGLCQLIVDPEKYAGRRVHIKSNVRPSAHSVISLYDDECKDAVVVLDVPNGQVGTPEIEKMMRVIWEGYPTPKVHNVAIDLYGVYQWKKREIPSRYIIVERVIGTSRDGD